MKTAILAALGAGKRIMEIYNHENFGIDFKSDDSPLTKADLASHKIIMTALKKTNIPVLSEEGRDIDYSERKVWDQLWIVDPIDGTKEFIKRNGEFTVNIALIENKKPVLGVIYVPALKDLYFASSDGSFHVKDIDSNTTFDDIAGNATKIPVYKPEKVYTIVSSKSHLSKETQDFIDKVKSQKGEIKTISKGSSLKLCMVAKGEADCYPRFAPTMEWDTAAGQAICSFAGKRVIDQETGEEMLYNRKDLLNNWFIVQ
ncbi:3'(2'),5'-bisphosphate nucleotidase CysQ [Zunongwangia endophytica]|uniref:3'(2'),5'-bisphosphate nucleotidase CysQ n=1 Tax=Zunongwangia endophytica TaxID=1808945 RepID=A0ABV8HAV5_9FLAO|nr:3'(2'),5'-bisphosphate nucleotidase CysQ [Zunongwangia endophytica]MDN3596238.1 3'(2'),5'-bisphosphate nucleotidase CysQ [Zunongwangia endophytica]